ncbi:MAG TPA: hypothetical protein VGE47_11835, partial [Burkholderiaceae bacterium]
MPLIPRSIVLALALLAGASQAEVRVAGGADRWSQIVQKDWAPRSEAAQAAFVALARAQYGVALAPADLLLRATPLAAAPESPASAPVVALDAGMPEAELRQRALLQPLREGMLRVVEQLSQGHGEALPAWLPGGLADATARDVVAGLGLSPLPPYAAEPPITRPNARATAAAQLVQNQREQREKRRQARAAVEALQQRLGPDFNARMKAYLTASAQAGFDAEAAFKQQFGIGTQALRDASAAAPAVGQGGATLVDDDERQGVHVAVKMGGYLQDEFAAEVERQWLPLVKQASSQFDRLVNEVLKVRLVRGARVYVGAGLGDYEQILMRDMNMTTDRAETQGEVSGGLSNGRGQIALKFTPRQSRAASFDMAVKTTLHELTHELQKQLDNNHAGFRPPIWLREGTADLMAYLLAPQVRVDDADAQALRNWRELNLSWWKQGN